EERKILRRGMAVRIVDIDELELSGGADGDADTDESLRQQRAIGHAPRIDGRDVGRRRSRAVVRPENRVETTRRVEAIAKVCGRDRPAVRRLMTRDTGAPVRANRLEERIREIDPAVYVDRGLTAGLVIEHEHSRQRWGERGCGRHEGGRHGPGRGARDQQPPDWGRELLHETPRPAPKGGPR